MTTHPQTAARWRMNRAGLFNFWYYEEQDYEFNDGHILFRGDNGAGKSVTMQSLVTFLLDGNKQPSRLDPFASKDRKMRDYLLGEKAVNHLDSRIGYLYLEFKMEDRNEYMTIGYGLQADPGTNHLKDWGFVLFDRHSRINRGQRRIRFYREEMVANRPERIPLTKKEFKKQLEGIGVVCESRQEYAMEVNRHLFGFSNPDKLLELTELLHNLKSPKLSKDFKPSVISEILTASLPDITKEEIGPLTDTIESIDLMEKSIQGTEQDLRSLGKLTKTYSVYNELKLLEKAYGYTEQLKRLEKQKKTQRSLLKQADEIERVIHETNERIDQLMAESQALEAERDSYGKDDLSKLKSRQFHLREERQKLETMRKTKLENAEEKERRLRTLEDAIQETEHAIQETERLVKDTVGDLTALSEEIAYLDHVTFSDQFKREYAEFRLEPIRNWRQSVRRHSDQLAAIRSVLQSFEKKQDARDYRLAEARNLEATLVEAEAETKRHEEHYQEVRDTYYEDVQAWLEGCTDFRLDPEEEDDVLGMTQQVLEGVSEETLKEPVRRAYDLYYQGRLGELAKFDAQIERIAAASAELEERRALLAQQEELDPTYEGDQEQRLAELAAHGVPYLPFYAAVEFKGSVAEDVRRRLESVMIDTGLLNGLIVPDAHQSRAMEHLPVLKTQPPVALNLTRYFDAVPGNGVTADEIHAVLRSISIEDGAAAGSLSSAGTFDTVWLAGAAADYGAATYIGKQAREQAKLRKLEALAFEQSLLSAEQEGLVTERNETKQRLEAAQATYQAFPETEDLRCVKNQYDTSAHMVDAVYKPALQKIQEDLEILKAEMNEEERQLEHLSAAIELPRTRSAYEEAAKQAAEYLVALSELERDYTTVGSRRRKRDEQGLQQEQLEEDVREAREDVAEYAYEVEKRDQALRSIDEQLNTSDAKDRERRYEEVLLRSREVPKLIDAAKDDRRDRIGEQQAMHRELGQLETELRAIEETVDAWAQVFDTEERLRFTAYPREKHESLQQAAARIAKEIMTGYDVTTPLAIQQRVEKNAEQLETVFGREYAYLSKYNILKKRVEDQTLPERFAEATETELQRLHTVAARHVIELELANRMRTPGEVEEKWTLHLAEKKELLNEEERRLFEVTMIESVGGLIREKIREATRWVKQMNTFMDAQEATGGLSFRIQWSPKEQEAGTMKQVVELLSKNPQILPDAEKKKISRFFEIKVKDAKRLVDKDGQLTLFEAINQALDYRYWYQIEVKYRSTDTDFQLLPLTDKKFNKFSGGEKALSMYVPLLSAVHSRLQEARETAPRIIALDEAFAGVDDKNINEMFALLEQLEFDYLMNSQALWGTYQSVSSLAIYQLIRPIGANVVAVEKYVWDGKTKWVVEETSHPDEEVMA